MSSAFGFKTCTSSSNWTLTPLVVRSGRTSAARLRFGARYQSSMYTGNGDDFYLFALDGVSLTVTPASEANSAEAWGLRVDGRDTLTQSISGLEQSDGATLPAMMLQLWLILVLVQK